MLILNSHVIRNTRVGLAPWLPATYHVDFRKNTLNCSPFVFNIMETGYYLPFLHDPPPCHAKNNTSSRRNPTFVSTAVQELLRNKCIEQVPPEALHCVNPLTVAVGAKLRLVPDLRHVNQSLDVTHFKYENLNVVAQLFERHFFFITFDLQNGYHYVPIAARHSKYLGFAWNSNGAEEYFQYLVLPFGYLFGRQRKRIWRVLDAAVRPGHRTRTIFTLGKGNQFHSPRTFRRPLRLEKLDPLSP